MANEIVKQNKVEEIALAKIQEYQELGLVLPEGFNPANSLKKARFILNDMKVNGKPVLEVCSQASIVQCLLESVTKGLSYDEMQIYFIPRNGVMTNMESVYGRIVRAKRASKNYKPIVGYVHEDDIFEFGTDVDTGVLKIYKHDTKLENLDKPIIAAYAYVTDNNGNTEITIMTRREWLTSWKKSPNGCAVAKEFEKDMIFRTIVKKSTKSLVNSNTNGNGIVQGYSGSDEDDTPLAGDMPTNIPTEVQDADYEEVNEDNVDVETGEVKEVAKEVVEQKEENKDLDF